MDDEEYYEPVEVCCNSCDGLIGWYDPDDPNPPRFPAYCGGQWCKAFAPM